MDLLRSTRLSQGDFVRVQQMVETDEIALAQPHALQEQPAAGDGFATKHETFVCLVCFVVKTLLGCGHNPR